MLANLLTFLEPNALWLRLVRKGDAVEIFYALDGENYSLLRLTYLPGLNIQVGLMCAAPEGNGFPVTFEEFTVTSTPA